MGVRRQRNIRSPGALAGQAGRSLRHAVYPLSANISDLISVFQYSRTGRYSEHLCGPKPHVQGMRLNHTIFTRRRDSDCLATALRSDAVGGSLRQEGHHGPYRVADSACGPEERTPSPGP
jgi:hypothetical protein